MDAENSNVEAVIPDSAAELFGGLYEEYLPRVFQYMNYRIEDRAIAEDLTSDIFNKALSGFAKYDSGKAAFSTWIYSIARNTLIDYYRGRSREQRLQKEAEPEDSEDFGEE